MSLEPPWMPVMQSAAPPGNFCCCAQHTHVATLQCRASVGFKILAMHCDHAQHRPVMRMRMQCRCTPGRCCTQCLTLVAALVLHAGVQHCARHVTPQGHPRDTEAMLRQMTLGAPVLDTASRVVALKLCENDIAGRPRQPLQANKGGAAHTILNGGIVHLQEGKATPQFCDSFFADVSMQDLPLNHAVLAQRLC